MKLPNFRRIFSSDFKEEFKQVMDQLGILFNGALEPVYNALNNNLTFADNFLATVTDINVSVNANGTPNQATSFKLSTNQKSTSGIFVINAFGANDSTLLPEAGVFIAFSQNGNSVNITSIKGLLPSITYTIRIVCLS